MKRELIKFFSRKSTYIAILLAIVSFCFYSIWLTKQAKSAYDISSYLGDYANIEELQQKYQNELDSFDEYKAEYEEYGFDLEPIYDVHAIYEYLLDNYMESDEASLLKFACLYESRDSLCVMLSLNNGAVIIMFVLMAFLSMAFFSNDFFEKKHRLIYAGKNRMKIMTSKFKAYMFVVVAFWIIFGALGAIFNYVFSEHIPNVLMEINGNVFSMPIFLFGLVEFASYFIQLLPFAIAFYFIAVLVRNDVGAGILDVILFVFVYIVTRLFSPVYMTIMGVAPFYNLGMEFSTVSEWLMSYGIEVGLVLLITVVSINVFKKADLH